jgi:hypothetical protein
MDYQAREKSLIRQRDRLQNPEGDAAEMEPSTQAELLRPGKAYDELGTEATEAAMKAEIG